MNQKQEPNIKRLYLFVAIVFLLLFCIAMLSGCVTEKQRQRILAECPHNDNVTIVKKDTIIYRDSAVYFSFPSDTIVINKECPNIKPFDVIKKKNGVTTEFKYNGKDFDCSSKIDSMKIVEQKIRADHFAEIDSMKNESYKVVCDKPHLKWFDPFCRWFTLITLVLCLGAIIGFGIKLYLKK